MGKFSCRKGAYFERKVAQMFEDVLGVKLTRTPQSGGWGKFHTKGDLVAPDDPDFPYFIECKFDVGWNLWNQLFSNAGPLAEWWKKTKQQAKLEMRLPVLVFAQNQRIPLAMISGQTFDTFELRHDSSYVAILERDDEQRRAVIITLDKFLKMNRN